MSVGVSLIPESFVTTPLTISSNVETSLVTKEISTSTLSTRTSALRNLFSSLEKLRYVVCVLLMSDLVSDLSYHRHN